MKDIKVTFCADKLIFDTVKTLNVSAYNSSIYSVGITSFFFDFHGQLQNSPRKAVLYSSLEFHVCLTGVYNLAARLIALKRQ